jgi:uncharacterized membrane protein YbhN (UPF0104 family)
MAVVLGFASMIPAGLGVRDVALVVILAPFFTTYPIPMGEEIDPKVMAIAIVAVQRFISILTELAISVLLVWNRHL